MNINALQYEIFRLILVKSEISLQELIQLRIVCKNWKSMIEKLCQERTSLKLFGSKNDLLTYCVAIASYTIHESSAYSEDFNLKKAGKDEDILGQDKLDINCHFLPSIFPNINKLTVGYSDLYKIDVAFLLSKWNLEFLTVRHDNLPKSVWMAINLHKSLKALHLLNDAYQENADHYKFPKLKLSVLPKLEKFSFIKYQGDMFPILRQVGPNLKHLTYCDIHTFTSQWQHLFAIKPELGKSLTHLTVFNMDPLKKQITEKEFIRLVCSKLASLTYLNLIDFYLVPLQEVITQYARLPKLSEVYFYINGGKSQCLKKASDMVQELPKFNLVKALHVSLDQNFFGAFFPILFPNAEIVTVKTGNPMITISVKKEARKFTKLQKFNSISVQRHLRCLDFTGRHAKDYDDFVYVRNLNWSYNPLEQKNPLAGMQPDDCVIS